MSKIVKQKLISNDFISIDPFKYFNDIIHKHKYFLIMLKFTIPDDFKLQTLIASITQTRENVNANYKYDAKKSFWWDTRAASLMCKLIKVIFS